MTRSFYGLHRSLKPFHSSVLMSQLRCLLIQRSGPQRVRSFTYLTLSVTSSWLVGSLYTPVRAATLLNNSGVQFDQDTPLESQFIQSHGAYQSTFGVIDLDTQQKTPLLIETKSSDNPETIFKPSSRRNHFGRTDDFLGTPGNAVPNPIANFTFKANKRYALYLESTYRGRPTGIVYSNTVLNPSREQQAKFTGTANDLCRSGVTVAWDDTGAKLVRNRQQQDRDFDDFLVRLKGTACGVGGGEAAPIAQNPPPAPPVGALPAAVPSGGGGSLLGLLPLLGLFALIGGGSDSTSSPPSRGGSNLINPNPLPPTVTPPISPPSCTGSNCQTVPEPMTILGSGVAIGIGSLMHRRRLKRQKR